MPEARKTPERKCIGCNEMKAKASLIRVVRNAEGEIFIDKTGKANGRGAYICNSRGCFAKARKAKRFDKAFGAAVPDEVYANLEGMISE